MHLWSGVRHEASLVVQSYGVGYNIRVLRIKSICGNHDKSFV